MEIIKSFYNSLDLNKLYSLFLYNPQEPLIFSSAAFLILFTLFLIFHRIFYKSNKLRIIYITLFSIYFYYKSSGYFFFLLIFTTVIDYLVAFRIYNTEIAYKRKFYLLVSLVCNLSILAYFKYTNFFIDTYNSLLNGNLQFYDIFLPAGISFYTFQSLSYSIDVYRKEIKPLTSYIDYLFCISFFPQLVAGPIIRTSVMIPQLEKEYYINKSDFGQAVYLIMAGLFKKVVIADFLSVNFVDRIFAEPLRYSGVENLFSVYAYAIQIYCDFSGYSDMAIGLALLLGIKLPVNFDSPYQSISLTEFWRRWHISLSSWLRDYLYIPLGGNRKGKLNTYKNLIITMLLGGLWHGANWKFVLWGFIHGFWLAIEKLFNLPKFYEKNPFTRFIGWLITFHIVCFCWIFFRANDFQHAIMMLYQISHGINLENLRMFPEVYNTILLVMLIGYALHYITKDIEDLFKLAFTELTFSLQIAYVLVILFIVLQFKTSDIQPFIYFQF